MSWSNDTKPVATSSNDQNQSLVRWDDSVITWDAPLYSWDNASTYSNDTKPTGTYTGDTKPS